MKPTFAIGQSLGTGMASRAEFVHRTSAESASSVD
jgi:hypothetical protein